jgi:hypothetical protein
MVTVARYFDLVREVCTATRLAQEWKPARCAYDRSQVRRENAARNELSIACYAEWTLPDARRSHSTQGHLPPSLAPRASQTRRERRDWPQ